MAPPLSKEEMATAEVERRRMLVNKICISSFFSVCQHIISVQTEPRLVLQLCGGDQASAARLLGNTSGIVGVLSLIINQAGGKLSDAIGRKPGFLLGPFCNFFLGLLVYKNSGNRLLVAICRTLRLIVTTFSSTVMCQAALTDVCSGKELALAMSKMAAAAGAAMLITPFLEARLLPKGLHYVYLALSGIAAAHVTFGLTQMEETLPESNRDGAKLSLQSVNPFGFIRVFTEGSYALRRLTVITTLQMFLEGKNVSDTAQIWVRDNLKWSVTGIRNFVIIYGILCTFAGMYITPHLLRTMNTRMFTSTTNMMNAFAFSVRGLAASTPLWLVSMVPMLPGVNGASATALKAIASDLAGAEGFGKGEFSAWASNLRALAGSVAPVLYGQTYAAAQKRGMNPGITFAVAGVLGAMLPELLLRATKDSDLQPPRSNPSVSAPQNAAPPTK